MVLLGRPAELAQCRKALSPDRDGAAGVVITGAPGIGKTSLWRAAAAALAGQQAVLRTTGLPSRRGGLGNLADLFDPVTEALLPRLPAPQADALRTAFGLSAAQTPRGETLLERAVVTALRDLAETGVVVAIDDEQWLDDDTRQLMQAAVVRLSDTPVRWLVAVRAGHEDPGLVKVLEHELGPRVERLDLAGLDDGALSDLIGQRFPGPWSPTVLGRVVMLAAGSPYAALELARETVARGGHDGTAVHLPSTLADSLRSRLGRLSPDVLAVVQAAALAETPTRTLLRAVGDVFAVW